MYQPPRQPFEAVHFVSFGIQIVDRFFIHQIFVSDQCDGTSIYRRLNGGCPFCIVDDQGHNIAEAKIAAAE